MTGADTAPAGPRHWIFSALNMSAKALAALFALLAIYTAGFGVFDNTWFLGIVVALGATISLLRDNGDRPIKRLVNFGVATVFLYLVWIWVQLALEQEVFFIEISNFQLTLGWIAFGLIAFATFREFGWPMVCVYLAMGAYIIAPFGADESWTRISENLWYSTDGVFGLPVQVVSRVVLIFIAFGAVLQASGAGNVLLKMAFAATSRFTGGPAHASIVGSALFGTISGAAVANVVSTGIFTIPIIKKAGFSPKTAGAVEASASTGGQVMPPVMGVVAFVMADVTGIPYLSIIVAALIPALFYYISLFVVVLVEARKLGIRPTPPEEREKMTRDDWLKSSSFFVPLLVIIFMLVEGRTAQYAGFCALVAATVMSLALFPDFRNPKAWWNALVDAGTTSATLMVVVIAVGFVIGVINMTGVGLQLSQAILMISGESLVVSLLLVMLGCLIMGMGVPSVTAYLVLALVMGPVLERLGVPTIAAHLFMLYFGVLSMVTPPVALAAFAAAPIARAKPMETGVEAIRLSFAGFIIPFLFVFYPDLLLIEGFTFVGLTTAIISFLLATWLIATAVARFDANALPVWQSSLRLGAAVLVLWPSNIPTIAGALLGLALIFGGRLATARTPAHRKN